MANNRVFNPITAAWEYLTGTRGAMRTQKQPVTAYHTGTVGADIAAEGTGVRIINDTAEPILVTINSIAFWVKQSEVFDEDFNPFTAITIDPTTSLGTHQVETATLAEGAVTTAGDMAVIITAADLADSPKTILIPVTTDDDTPAKIMDKVRTAVAADADVEALFTVSGADSDLVLTRDKVRAIANDATLNIDLGGTGTTAEGITQAATSANTTAGVAPTAIGYRLWVRG